MARLATIAPFGFDDFTPRTLLPLYRRLGCCSAQLYRNPEACVNVEDARRLAVDVGLPIDSVHGWFGPDLDPSSPNEAVRSRSIRVYYDEAEVALQVGGPQVVVHPAPMRREGQVVTPDEDRARWSALEQSALELATEGERRGVTFLLENLPGNYCHGHNPTGMADLVRRVGHPRLRMCFDTGHAHMTEGAVVSLEGCSDAVGFLHVHDNDGSLDSHDVPGQGTLPWEALAPHVGHLAADATAMLELFEPESSILRHTEAGLGERLRQWLALGQQQGDPKP